MDAHAFGSATRLTREIRDRRVGCLELLDFYLARAERHNPALNAIIAWQIDAARQRARHADAALVKGEVWEPLHGIPMTVFMGPRRTLGTFRAARAARRVARPQCWLPGSPPGRGQRHRRLIAQSCSLLRRLRP